MLIKSSFTLAFLLVFLMFCCIYKKTNGQRRINSCECNWKSTCACAWDVSIFISMSMPLADGSSVLRAHLWLWGLMTRMPLRMSKCLPATNTIDWYRVHRRSLLSNIHFDIFPIFLLFFFYRRRPEATMLTKHLHLMHCLHVTTYSRDKKRMCWWWWCSVIVYYRLKKCCQITIT